jgi:hypothetical protein
MQAAHWKITMGDPGAASGVYAGYVTRVALNGIDLSEYVAAIHVHSCANDIVTVDLEMGATSVEIEGVAEPHVTALPVESDRGTQDVSFAIAGGGTIRLHVPVSYLESV